MTWRKTLAWCLSLALLLGSVSFAGLLPAAADTQPTATVVPMTADNLFSDATGVTNLMTSTAQLGVSGGNLQASCTKYFDATVPGVTTTDPNWGDWNGLGANTDYYLWYDFGTETPVNAIEVGGINGHSGFPTYTLPAFSLYVTNDLSALQAGTLTPVASVSETETAKNVGFVAVLSETVSVRYVAVKTRSYSHVGKNQECWFSEFGAACATDEQKQALIVGSNAYAKYVTGALPYALTEAPEQQSLIRNLAPVAGPTAYSKTTVGAGKVASLTDGLYPGLNQKITVARNEDDSIQSNQWGVITTTNDTVGTFGGISSVSNYCDVTFDMGVSGRVDSFLIGSTAEPQGVALSAVEGKSEAEIQALLQGRMSTYVRLHTGAFYVSEDKDTLFNDENRAAAWDYMSGKTIKNTAATTPLAAQYVLDEVKTGRYVGFRLYDCSYGNDSSTGTGWWSQIRVGELAVFGSVPNVATRTAVTEKEQLPSGRSLISGKVPYNTSGSKLSSANGTAIGVLTDGRYQGLDDMVTYITSSDPGTEEKPNDPVPGQTDTYFSYWPWGYAMTDAEDTRVTFQASDNTYRLYFDLGDTTELTDFVVGSSAEIKAFRRGAAPTTVESYENWLRSAETSVYLNSAKVWVSDDPSTLYSDDNLCVNWSSPNKADGLRNRFTLRQAVSGRYVGFELPSYSSILRVSELAVYGEDSLTVTELDTAHADQLPRNNLLAGLQALTGGFSAVADTAVGYEVNGVIGGVTQSAAEEQVLCTATQKLSYVLPSSQTIDRILVAGSLAGDVADGVDTQHVPAYKVYISNGQNTLWNDNNCVLSYVNTVTQSGQGICQLLQLKTPVSGRYVGFELSAGTDGMVRVGELGVYACRAKTMAIQQYDFRKLPADRNLLTGLTVQEGSASVGFTATYEGTDGILCRVNVPQDFTNQMGVSGMSSSSPASFYFDLGAEIAVDRLLFGNNGSDGGSTYMEPYYQIFVGNDADTLFSGTPLIDNQSATSAQAFLHTLEQPVTVRYVGYRIGGVNNAGRIAELGVYAADAADLAVTAAPAQAAGTDLLAGLTPSVSGTDTTYTLDEVKLPASFSLQATAAGSLYVSSLKAGLYAPENRVADFAAGDSRVTLEEAVTGRYIGVRLAGEGTVTAAAYEGNVSVTQINEAADAAKVPVGDGLLNGITPKKYTASSGSLTAIGSGTAYGTDGKIGGVNAETVLEEKLAVSGDDTGMADLIYALDGRYAIDRFVLAASNEGMLQGTTHYELYVSDHPATLFRQQNRVLTYENTGEYNMGQMLMLANPAQGRYVGLRIQAGSYNVVRIAEFNAFGERQTNILPLYNHTDAGRLPTGTNLITGKEPINEDANVSGADKATDNVIYGIQNGQWRTSGNQMTAYTTAPTVALTYALDGPTLVEQLLVASYSNCMAAYERIQEYQIFVGNDAADLYTAENRVASYTAADGSLAQKITLDEPALGTYVGFLVKVNDGVYTAFGGTHFMGIGDLGVYGTSASSAGTPVAMEGAQARPKNTEGTGLRFATSVLAEGTHAACLTGDTVQVNGEAKTVARAGTLVIRASKLTGELAFDSEGGIPAAARDVAANRLYIRGDGYVTYTVTVINIPDAHLNDSIVARSYLLLEDGTVVYGNTMTRSVNRVREAAQEAAGQEILREANESTFNPGDGTVSLSHFGEYAEMRFTRTYSDGVARTARIAIPDTVAEGNHWVYQAEFYGHPDAALTTARQFVRDGWYVVYLGGIGDTYGCDATLAIMDEFQQALVQCFGLNDQCVMYGISRGGLYSTRYALAYPENVAGLCLDAPVQDIRSWPGAKVLREAGLATSDELKGTGGGTQVYIKYPDGSSMSDWEGCKLAFGFASDEEAAYDRTVSPVWNYARLQALHIPVLLQISRTDTCVPYDENGLKMYQQFTENGAKTMLIEDTEANLNAHVDITAYEGYQLMMIEATDISTSRRGGHVHGWYTPALTSAYVRANMSGN